MKKLKEFFTRQPRTCQCQWRPERVGHGATGAYQRYLAKRSRERGLDPEKCQRDAAVEIGGRKLCRIHGGQVALEKLEQVQDVVGEETNGGPAELRRIREILNGM